MAAVLVKRSIGFPNTFPMDGDLSSGWCYPTFKQPGPGFFYLSLKNSTYHYVNKYYYYFTG